MKASDNGCARRQATASGGMETLAIVLLFATMLGLGGFIWWPFFVGAVLLAILVYCYYHNIRKVQ